MPSFFCFEAHHRGQGRIQKNISGFFLVQMRTRKFASEIYWPLKVSLSFVNIDLTFALCYMRALVQKFPILTLFELMHLYEVKIKWLLFFLLGTAYSLFEKKRQQKLQLLVLSITFLIELVSKELIHLAAILHVYAGGLNFMK